MIVLAHLMMGYSFNFLKDNMSTLRIIARQAPRPWTLATSNFSKLPNWHRNKMRRRTKNGHHLSVETKQFSSLVLAIIVISKSIFKLLELQGKSKIYGTNLTTSSAGRTILYPYLSMISLIRYSRFIWDKIHSLVGKVSRRYLPELIL